MQHGSQIRRSALQDILDKIPGITVEWTAMQLGRGHTLASNAEYQAFLEGSNKEKDGADSNPNPKLNIIQMCFTTCIGFKFVFIKNNF